MYPNGWGEVSHNTPAFDVLWVTIAISCCNAIRRLESLEMTYVYRSSRPPSPHCRFCKVAVTHWPTATLSVPICFAATPRMISLAAVDYVRVPETRRNRTASSTRVAPYRPAVIAAMKADGLIQ